MLKLRFLILCFFLCSVSYITYAQTTDSLRILLEEYQKLMEIQETDAISLRDPDLELTGFIVDETQTKIGKDFFDIFYNSWEAPVENQDYSIVISERPLPRLGTQITITVNDYDIFQQFLQPKYDAVEEMAEYGLQAAASFLANFEEVQKELQGDDLKGTGIY